MRLIRIALFIPLILLIAASAAAQESTEIAVYRDADGLSIVTPGIALDGVALEIKVSNNWVETKPLLDYPAFAGVQVIGASCFFIVQEGSDAPLLADCQNADIYTQKLPASDPFWENIADSFSVINTRSGQIYGTCDSASCAVTFSRTAEASSDCVGSAADNETLIAIARFDVFSTLQLMPDQEWEAIFEYAQDQLGDVGNIRVLTVPEIVTNQTEAAALAQCYGARIFVWGHLTPLRFETNLTLHTPWDDSDTFPTQPQRTGDQVKLLIALDSTDAEYLLYFTFAQLLYAGGNFEAALPFIEQAIAAAPEGRERELSVAALHFYNGYIEQTVHQDIIGAYTAYSTALDLDPEGDFAPAAYNNRGLVSNSRGQYLPAISDFDHAIALRPDSAAAYNNRGIAYHNRGQYEQAVADFDQAIALQPGYASAYHNRGNAYSIQGIYDLALADYDQAITLQSHFAMAYFDRGNVYQAQEKYALAISDYSLALTFQPDFADAFNNRGNAFYNQTNYNQAIDDYSQAIALKPDYMLALYNRGNAYRLQGAYGLAIADFDQVIAIQYNYVGAYHNRALAYSEIGQYSKAIADYDRAIELQSDDPQLYYLRGSAHFTLREYDLAIADYDQAIALQPDIVDAWIERGLAHVRQADYALALADFDQAIRLQPDYARLYFFRGIVHFNQDDNDLAIADYSQAITLDPTYVDAIYYRGVAYSFDDQYDLAIADYDRAIELQPGDPYMYYDRGDAYLSKYQYELAISDYKQAVALKPDYVNAYWSLGLAYRLNGQDAEALPYYQQYVELAGNDAEPLAVQTLHELEALLATPTPTP